MTMSLYSYSGGGGGGGGIAGLADKLCGCLMFCLYMCLYPLTVNDVGTAGSGPS